MVPTVVRQVGFRGKKRDKPTATEQLLGGTGALVLGPRLVGVVFIRCFRHGRRLDEDPTNRQSGAGHSTKLSRCVLFRPHHGKRLKVEVAKDSKAKCAVLPGAGELRQLRHELGRC